MQIINNTGAIIKEQINLGNIDNLNIDDLFKNNTSKKMKNNNYPNWLVSLEIAKELKEIGFNEPCLVENVETHSEDYSFINFEEEMCSDVSVMLEDVVFVKNQFLEDELGIYKHFVLKTAIPTWEQVFEWFRSKGYHGIIAAKGEDGENEYSYCIDYLNELSSDFEQDSHLTYEEAREALIKALIRTYKNEQL
ncbi:hypothetical protein [Capnocytophaga granulosa]|uniref:hypothetical protein n=1 Tax=Capnocytophaga granulosa TaxID=45242 RepID=UPI00385752AD